MGSLKWHNLTEPCAFFVPLSAYLQNGSVEQRVFFLYIHIHNIIYDICIYIYTHVCTHAYHFVFFERHG